MAVKISGVLIAMHEGLPENLSLSITDQPSSELLARFYSGYERVFALPDERESFDGFRDCLTMNFEAGETVHERFGSSREFIGILCGDEGEVAAGFNFICFPMPQFGSLMTLHSIYVFVHRAWRRNKLLKKIYNIMADACKSYAVSCGIHPNPNLIFFGEQNDPFRMTMEQFILDAGTAGINQFDRILIWRRLGARLIAFPYVQPALSELTAPDRTLFLRVLWPDEPIQASGHCRRQIDPRILREHLLRFFAITVLKGRRDPFDLTEARAQIDLLDSAVSSGTPIEALPLANESTLVRWKECAESALQKTDCHYQQVGDLLGIPSLLEGVRRQLHDRELPARH